MRIFAQWAGAEIALGRSGLSSWRSTKRATRTEGKLFRKKGGTESSTLQPAGAVGETGAAGSGSVHHYITKPGATSLGRATKSHGTDSHNTTTCATVKVEI